LKGVIYILKKIVCFLLASAVAVTTFAFSAFASGEETAEPEKSTQELFESNFGEVSFLGPFSCSGQQIADGNVPPGDYNYMVLHCNSLTHGTLDWDDSFWLFYGSSTCSINYDSKANTICFTEDVTKKVLIHRALYCQGDTNHDPEEKWFLNQTTTVKAGSKINLPTHNPKPDLQTCTFTVSDENGKDFDLGDTPTPYIISYSPTLTTNMSRTIEQNGETFTIDSIKVTFSMNPKYVEYAIKKQFAEKYPIGSNNKFSIDTMLDRFSFKDVEIGNAFNITGMLFISTLGQSSDLSEVYKNCCYTYMSQQKYSIVDREVGGVNGSTSSAIYAKGLYPCFSYNPKFSFVKFSEDKDTAKMQYNEILNNLPTFTLDIPLKNLKTDTYKSDVYTLYTIYKCPSSVNHNDFIYPATTEIDNDLTNDPDDTISANSGTIAEFYSKKKENHTEDYYYNFKDFSFDSYPDYEPPVYNGTEYSSHGDPTNYAKNPYKPDKFVSKDLETDKDVERTPEEQIQHDKDRHFSENMLTADVTSIGTLLDGTSQYFRFLTAGLMIFPSWFLTAITAFFSIILTIVLIGTVLKLITGVVGSIGNFLGGGKE